MIEEQASDSLSQETQTTPESSISTDKQLTGDQLKSGMFDEINKSLGEVKDVTKETPEEDKEEEIVDKEKKVEPKKEEKKPEDKDDVYKMPEGLQKASRERFQKLVDTAKQEKQRATDLEAVVAEKESVVTNFRAILEETKTSSEDLSQMLEYNRLVKTGDIESAMSVLDEQRTQLAKMLGRPVEGINGLEEFKDLEKGVTDGKLTIEHAYEIAKSRRVQEAMQYQRQSQDQVAQEAGNKQRSIDQALGSIQQFAEDMASKDVDYSKKEEILLKSVNAISSKFPANLWLDQVRMLYENISVIPTLPVNTQRNSPLRPNSGGGGAPQPKNMFDAINNGLKYGVS